MEFLLSDELSLDLPRAGDIRRGEVIEHLRNAILVDIGAKSEGIIAGSELDALSPEERDELAIGNEVAVYVVDPEDEDGNIVLSYTRAAEEEDWRLAQELADTSDVYQGKVVGYNKGVSAGRGRPAAGFMPIGQLGPSRNFNRENAPAMQLAAHRGRDDQCEGDGSGPQPQPAHPLRTGSHARSAPRSASGCSTSWRLARCGRSCRQPD